MPVDFLTEAERERWQRLPDTMPQDDLFVFFLLSDEDRRETQQQRDPRIAWAMPSSCVSSGISDLCLTTSKRPHTRLSRSWPSNWRLIRVCSPCMRVGGEPRRIISSMCKPT